MADVPTLADVRALFPGGGLLNPPSKYFDLENQKGSSRFPPGRAPAFYDPFIRYFDERAQTAAAQARLEERKQRPERARHYAELAQRWREASRVALIRKQRALVELADQVAAAIDKAEMRPAIVCCWCTPHHTIRPGRQPASHGLCAAAAAEQAALLAELETGRGGESRG